MAKMVEDKTQVLLVSTSFICCQLGSILLGSILRAFQFCSQAPIDGPEHPPDSGYSAPFGIKLLKNGIFYCILSEALVITRLVTVGVSLISPSVLGKYDEVKND